MRTFILWLLLALAPTARAAYTADDYLREVQGCGMQSVALKACGIGPGSDVTFGTITATTVNTPAVASTGNTTLTVGTNAGTSNITFSVGGGVSPAFQFQTVSTLRFAITSGVNGIGMQLRTAQSVAPTCTSNCGTSPSVVGSDTAMIVTMGASGAPASGWVVTFNGTWASAPSCAVTSALTTMVAGKAAIAVQTSTTTITVTTNGTAPGNSDKYAIQCLGVS